MKEFGGLGGEEEVAELLARVETNASGIVRRGQR